MSVSLIKITNDGDQTYASAYGFTSLFQRKDGVLACYYCAEDINGYIHQVVSYSYDYGLTWTQTTVDDNASASTVNNPYYGGILLSDYSLYYICDQIASPYDARLMQEVLCENANELSTLPASTMIMDMITDSSDNIHILYRALIGTYNLYYRKWNGTSWSDADFIATDPDNFARARLLQKSDGSFRIVYNDTDDAGTYYYDLFYIEGSEGSWSVAENIEVDNLTSRSIWDAVLDDNGKIHICYSRWGVIFGGYGSVYHSVRDDDTQTWTRTLVSPDVENGKNYDDGVQMTKDAEGNLYIVYLQDIAGVQDFYFSKSTDNGVTWSAPEFMFGETSGMSPGTGIDLLYTFKEQRYIDGVNILNKGFAGIIVVDSELYYYYSDDIEYKYEISGSTTYCDPDPILPDEIEMPCGYVGTVTTNVANLDHLEGQTVAIYANGEVLDRQVVTNGEIDLSGIGNYSIVHVGLPIESDLETLNVEVPLNEGAMQAERVKVNNVLFRLYNSRGGYIGYDEDNLWEAFTQDQFRYSSGENLGDEEMFTGDVRVPLGSQFEPGGRVFYRQSDPLPVTIGAIIPEVTIGGATR